MAQQRETIEQDQARAGGARGCALGHKSHCGTEAWKVANAAWWDGSGSRCSATPGGGAQAWCCNRQNGQDMPLFMPEPSSPGCAPLGVACEASAATQREPVTEQTSTQLTGAFPNALRSNGAQLGSQAAHSTARLISQTSRVRVEDEVASIGPGV